jgi:hypothetical protein
MATSDPANVLWTHAGSFRSRTLVCMSLKVGNLDLISSVTLSRIIELKQISTKDNFSRFINIGAKKQIMLMFQYNEFPILYLKNEPS